MKFTAVILIASTGFSLAENLRANQARKLTGHSGDEQCLEAVMGPSNESGLDIEGKVKVCFDGLDGTLEMDVEGLPANINGGVHIHEGISCESAAAQMGHYYVGPNTSFDPWFMTPSPIAPDGTGYFTDDEGEGEVEFEFNQGAGYADTIGRVVVIHGNFPNPYARIGCGVLEAAEED